MKLARPLALLAAVLLAVVVHRHHACDDCMQHVGASCDDDASHEDCHGLCDLEPVASQVDREIDPRVGSTLDFLAMAPRCTARVSPEQRDAGARRVRPPPGARHRIRARHRIDGRGCILLQ